MQFKDLAIGDRFHFKGSVFLANLVVTNISPASPEAHGKTHEVEVKSVSTNILGYVTPFNKAYTDTVVLASTTGKISQLYSISWYPVTSTMTFKRRNFDGTFTRRNYVWKRIPGSLAIAQLQRWYCVAAELEALCNSGNANITLFKLGWYVTIRTNNQGE